MEGGGGGRAGGINQFGRPEAAAAWRPRYATRSQGRRLPRGGISQNMDEVEID